MNPSISPPCFLAAVLAPGIRVNAMAPGWVNTHLNDEVFAETAGGVTVAVARKLLKQGRLDRHRRW